MSQSIIGVMGFKGSGKDTAIQSLIQTGYKKFAFADTPKDVVAAIFSWPRDMVEGDTIESREWREKIDPYWASKLNIPDFSPRYALNHIATDVIRQHFDDRIWILNTLKRIIDSQATKIILSDCRFANETAEVRKQSGKLIRIKRGEDPAFFSYTSNAALSDPIVFDEAKRYMANNYPTVHLSEWAWNHIKPDIIIENNSTKEELAIKMMEWENTWN